MKLSKNEKRIIYKINNCEKEEFSYRDLKEKQLGSFLKHLEKKGLLKISKRVIQKNGVNITYYRLSEKKLPKIDESEIEMIDYEPEGKTPGDWYREKRARLKNDPIAKAEYLKKRREYSRNYKKKNPEKIKEMRKREYEKLKADPKKYRRHLEKENKRKALLKEKRVKEQGIEYNSRKTVQTKPKIQTPKPKIQKERKIQKLRPKQLMNLGIDETKIKDNENIMKVYSENGGKASVHDVEKAIKELVTVVSELHGVESLFANYRYLSRYLYGETIKTSDDKWKI